MARLVRGGVHRILVCIRNTRRLRGVMTRLTSTGYQPDFDIDLRKGQLGEELFGTFWEELHRTGTVEVKVDRGSANTGNHYVETHQYDGAAWRPSGLSTTKAVWWALVSPSDQGFLVVRVDVLKLLARDAPQRSQNIKTSKTNASTGRLVRVEDMWRAMMREVV